MLRVISWTFLILYSSEFPDHSIQTPSPQISVTLIVTLLLLACSPGVLHTCEPAGGPWPGSSCPLYQHGVLGMDSKCVVRG